MRPSRSGRSRHWTPTRARSSSRRWSPPIDRGPRCGPALHRCAELWDSSAASLDWGREALVSVVHGDVGQTRRSSRMRSPLRARAARVLSAGALVVATMLTAAAPAAAAAPVVLRVGTTQALDSLNPYATLLVLGYEAFQLNYNL